MVPVPAERWQRGAPQRPQTQPRRSSVRRRAARRASRHCGAAERSAQGGPLAWDHAGRLHGPQLLEEDCQRASPPQCSRCGRCSTQPGVPRPCRYRWVLSADDAGQLAVVLGVPRACLRRLQPRCREPCGSSYDGMAVTSRWRVWRPVVRNRRSRVPRGLRRGRAERRAVRARITGWRSGGFGRAWPAPRTVVTRQVPRPRERGLPGFR